MAGKPLAATGPASPLSSSLVCPSLEKWLNKIRQSDVAGQPGEITPLVLDRHGRLYLRRYWEYENCISRFIVERSTPDDKKIDYQKLGEDLAALFPDAPSQKINWQKIAAFGALTRRFCIIEKRSWYGPTI